MAKKKVGYRLDEKVIPLLDELQKHLNENMKDELFAGKISKSDILEYAVKQLAKEYGVSIPD